MAQKTKNENKKVKLWVRLGGYIELTPKEASQVKKDQLSVDDIEAIVKERGFEVNGDCYSPDENGDALELGDLGPFKLKFAGNEAPAK